MKRYKDASITGREGRRHVRRAMAEKHPAAQTRISADVGGVVLTGVLKEKFC